MILALVELIASPVWIVILILVGLLAAFFGNNPKRKGKGRKR